MQHVRPVRSTALVILAVVAVTTMLACSKSDDAAPDGTTTLAPSSTVAPPITPPNLAPNACSIESLTVAAVAKYPGVTLSEVVCDATFGAATLNGGEGRTATGVALFRVTDGAWALVTDGPDTADATIVPVDFSKTVFNTWKNKRNLALNPKPPAAPPKPTAPVTVSDNEQNSKGPQCEGEGGDTVCEEPTVVVTQPGDTLPTSMFCKYNYNDPSCKEDKSYSP